MSKTFNVHDAKTRLSQLLDEAHAGEEINTRHHDPFDRIVAAQSQLEQVPLLTADPAFTAFPIETLW